MSFNNSQHTNASGSNFTDVNTISGDYVQIVNNFNFFQHSSLDFGLPGPDAYCNTTTQVLSGAIKPPISRPIFLQSSSEHLSSPSGLMIATSSQRILDNHIEITASNGISLRLIVKIMELLVYPYRSDDFQGLQRELRSLQKMFTLTELAIRACESMPLGHSLAGAINQEVDGCSVVLQTLLSKIKSYQQDLSSTPISCLWRRVAAVSNSRDEESLSAFEGKLSVHRKSLGQCLIALKLLSWMTDLDRSRTGCPSLHDFYTFLAQGGDSFHHIQANTVLIVDHLGRNIPIPTIFCSDWKSIDYIINRYCENTIGSDFIQRGEYRIIRAQDNKVIERSKFASAASPETKFEISIVMRQTKKFARRCPQCGGSNFRVEPICGWIKCSRCSKQYEVISKRCPRCRNLNLNISVHDNWIECRKCGGQFQVQEDDSLGAGFQEIFSPSLQTGRVRQMANIEDQQECGNDIAQFFRLIHLIHPRNQSERLICCSYE